MLANSQSSVGWLSQVRRTGGGVVTTKSWMERRTWPLMEESRESPSAKTAAGVDFLGM